MENNPSHGDQPMSGGKVRGFMCPIAFRHELGETTVVIYPTAKSLRKIHKSHHECGIYEVEVKLKRVVKRGKLP